MNDAFITDWAALGLPDNSPFAILSQPRAPIKTPPPQHKKPRKTNHEKTLASLRDLPTPGRFCTDIMSREECDRTQSIVSRGAV